ncbi:MAG: nucleoside deaminase [Pseudanabaena sp. ELA607]
MTLPIPWQTQLETDQLWMDQALDLAIKAGQRGEIPIGALIVDQSGKCIAASGNTKEQTHNATAHAEIVVLRSASQVLKEPYLTQCTLYVTLEPCPMCAGAILQARVGRLVYGTADPKAGAINTVLNLPASEAAFHSLQVTAGIRETSCRNLLQHWFADLRQSSSLKSPAQLKQY